MRPSDQTTHASLLLRLRDTRDAEAWQQFVEVYTPLIYGFCRQHGLQDADAADVSQEVMLAVVRAIGRFEYDPQRGRFRAWLRTVTRNKLWDFLARQKREPQPCGETTTLRRLQAPADTDDSPDWDAAYRRRLFEVAAEKVRSEVQPGTWQAFRQVVWEQQDAKEVAQRLGLSVGAVYIAKSRVLARLKEHIRAIDHETHEPFEGTVAVW